MPKTKVLLLGSSGSIGESTLDVLRKHADKFELAGLACGKRYENILKQVEEFRPKAAAITDPAAAKSAKDGIAALKKKGVKTEWFLSGQDDLVSLAKNLDYDVCLGAITGAAGLASNLEAARRGKRLALANKESLVMTGPILTDICKKTGAELLPVDSEHSAIFQCLRGENNREIKRVILTASGGPFRQTPIEDLKNVTLEQALKHPTWVMGRKITIDSATLFNKALEVIEARWLFDLKREQIDAVIHPQSIIHSMVEFIDHSIIAQLGPTDMKIPIQYALSYPHRIESSIPAATIQWMSNMTLEEVNFERFPALKLGFEVAAAGGTLSAAMNAANEVAVERFLNREIKYLDIYATVKRVVDAHKNIAKPTLEQVLETDKWARAAAAAGR